jgi:hypothetical protein
MTTKVLSDKAYLEDTSIMSHTLEKGVWYMVEKEGAVGGGRGGAGSGAWHDVPAYVLPGDMFRLKSSGSDCLPAIWEVKFISPLR